MNAPTISPIRPILAAALAVLMAAEPVPRPAFASCVADDRALEQQVAEADTAFVGTVIDLRNDDRAALFSVADVWTGGDLPTEVWVAGGPEGAITSVDRNWVAGERYLVLPYGELGALKDNNCSPSRRWTDDLASARPAAAHPPTDSPSSTADAIGVPPARSALAIAALALLGVGVWQVRHRR